jgi:cytochrome c oxidase cbb3-type subunit 3
VTAAPSRLGFRPVESRSARKHRHWRETASCAVAILWLISGCDRTRSASSDLREWKPTDHHSRDDDRPIPNAATSASAQPDQESQLGQLVEFAWHQQCANCHGLTGKGDGPSGPMVGAPDLTIEAWQAKVSDSELAEVIRFGKGKMPKFDLLPDAVRRGLVSRVRLMRGR